MDEITQPSYIIVNQGFNSFMLILYIPPNLKYGLVITAFKLSYLNFQNEIVLRDTTYIFFMVCYMSYKTWIRSIPNKFANWVNFILYKLELKFISSFKIKCKKYPGPLDVKHFWVTPIYMNRQRFYMYKKLYIL